MYKEEGGGWGGGGREEEGRWKREGRSTIVSTLSQKKVYVIDSVSHLLCKYTVHKRIRA